MEAFTKKSSKILKIKKTHPFSKAISAYVMLISSGWSVCIHGNIRKSLKTIMHMQGHLMAGEESGEPNITNEADMRLNMADN